MRNRLHKTIFYTLLLAVYSTFFSVESFYNFEGQINAKEIFRYVSLTQQHRPRVIGTTPLHGSSLHKIRLNKRFHQEDMPPCPVFSPAAPIANVPAVNGPVYRDAVLPSIALLSYPLRGPPVVA
jgi:hypothetical protein